MKRTKRRLSALVALCVALVMVLGMCVSAFAAETKYTITINQTEDDDKAQHTYEAYQIFAGSFEAAKLTDITWGSGINGTSFLSALKSDSTFSGAFAACTTAQDVADKMTSLSTEQVKHFAQIAGNYKGAIAGTSVNGQITDLSAGYYLVKDKDDSLTGKEGAYTQFILNVVQDITVDTKESVPGVEKKVKDINDSTETAMSDWQDSADHDIGDIIPYQLKGTLPSTYADYKTYYYEFVDKMSKGLTLDENSVVVKVDGNIIQSNLYTVSVTNSPDSTGDYKDGKVMSVVFDDLKLKVPSASENSIITVDYNVTLNSDAVIGTAGNPNVVYLKYSNNPNDNHGGEIGQTPEDKNIVFTYEVVVNKVTENNVNLAGAVFKLEKKNQDGTWKDLGQATATGADRNIFTWKGVDDGHYKLTEISSPTGYNKIDPIEFDITAKHDTSSADPKLTELKGTTTNLNENFDFTHALTEGRLSTNIKNKEGTVLPSTGGEGVKWFYIIGGILAGTAAVLLIARKRSQG